MNPIDEARELERRGARAMNTIRGEMLSLAGSLTRLETALNGIRKLPPEQRVERLRGIVVALERLASFLSGAPGVTDGAS